MKIILSGVLISLLVCFPALAKPKSSNLPYCDFAEEEPSSIERTVTLTEVGISIKIPVNTRVVKKTDGSIELMDNGTYQLFQCSSKPNSGVAGRGYLYTKIEKSKTDYLYSNVLKEVPGKEKMWIAAKTNYLQDGSKDFDIWLRIQTSKGIFDISTEQYGPLQTQQEIKEKVKEMIAIALFITINE